MSENNGIRKSTNDMIKLGWREWVVLPNLNVPAIKAKIDTGARTSALHAFNIERDGAQVSFSVQPLQRNTDVVMPCVAPLVDIRVVTDSGGHSEERYVISTDLQIGSLVKRIEITLTERHDMLFRMLIGRTALLPECLVDPASSYLCGKLSPRLLYPQMGIKRSKT
jgi:hypothetical protein